MATRSDKLNGISGWLILVAIGIVLTPIRIAVVVLPMYTGIFTNGTWEVLTYANGGLYDPFWAPILIGQIVINVGLIGLWLYVASIFFSKQAIFPKVFIGTLILSMAFIIIGAFALTLVMPEGPLFDSGAMKELSRTVIASIIFIPYMLKSKRVKATFINT